MRITAHQFLDCLRIGDPSWTYSDVASASVEVTQSEHTLVLTIPSPPSDEELQKARD